MNPCSNDVTRLNKNNDITREHTRLHCGELHTQERLYFRLCCPSRLIEDMNKNHSFPTEGFVDSVVKSSEFMLALKIKLHLFTELLFSIWQWTVLNLKIYFRYRNMSWNLHFVWIHFSYLSSLQNMKKKIIGFLCLIYLKIKVELQI